MGQGFAKLPDDANVRLVNARVPTALFMPPSQAVSTDDLTTVDILIDKGNIAAIGWLMVRPRRASIICIHTPRCAVLADL